MNAPSPGALAGAHKLARKTYLVDRRFQLKYTALLALMGALISFVFGAMMYLAHRRAQRELEWEGLLPPEAAQHNAGLLGLMVGIGLMMAVALGLFGLLITHKVAGPVQVLTHYLGVLARGRYPLMRPLRDGDELQAFFGRFQAAIHGLREREVQEAEALERALTQLESHPAAGELGEVLQALRAMRDHKREATDLGVSQGAKSAA
jgi:hypothetical protein